MTQAALDEYALSKGITKAVKDMTEQEKVALRYNFVLEKMSGATGDFMRTQKTWANQTRILRLQFDSIISSIGQGIINLWTPVLNFINMVLEGLAKVADAFRQFTVKITGGEETTSGEGAAARAAGEAMEFLTDETEESTEATKEAEKANKKFLSGLDEISRWDSGNKKKDEESSQPMAIDPFTMPTGAGGNNASSYPFLDTLAEKLKELKKRMKELSGLFKVGFKIGSGDLPGKLQNIKDNIQGIKDALAGIHNDPRVQAAASNLADSFAYNLGRITGAAASIGAGAAQLFTGAYKKYLEKNAPDIKKSMINMFDIGAEIFSLMGGLGQSIAQILEPLWGELGQNILSNVFGIITTVGTTVLETLLKVARDVLGMIVKPIEENKEKLQTALENLLAIISPIVEGVLNFVKRVKEGVTELYDEHIKPVIDKITNTITKVVGNLTDAWNNDISPVLQKLSEKAKEIIEGPLGDLATNILGLIGDIVDEIGVLWDETIDPFLTWLSENVGPVLAPIIDTVGTKLLEALEWIIEKLDELVTWLRENKPFIETMSAVLIGLFAGWATVKTANSISKVVSAFTGFGSITGIITKVKGAFSSFSTFLGGPWAIVIAAVVAGAILVYTHWDDIKKFWEEKLKPAIQALKDKFDEFVKFIKDEVNQKIEDLRKKCEEVKTFFENAFTKAVNTLKEKFEAFRTKIKEVKEGVENFKQEALDKIHDFIQEKLIGTVEKIAKAFSDFWDNHLGPVATNIKNTLQPALDGIQGVVTGLQTAIDGLKAIWGTAWDWILDKINFVKGPIETAINAIKTPIDAALQAFANLLNAGGTQITYNPPASTTAANAYGGTIYAPIVGSEASTSSLPPDVSLKSTVPLLARGAVIPPNAPFLAVLGDQRSGTNVEAPLSTIEQAVRNALGGGGRPTKLIVTLDRRVLFDAVIDVGKDTLVRTGNNAFEMG